jgi:hypothetical protein
MRLLAFALLLSISGCGARTSRVAAAPPRPAPIDTLRIPLRVPPLQRGYSLDCLTPPDSTGACVLRDQRVGPLLPR